MGLITAIGTLFMGIIVSYLFQTMAQKAAKLNLKPQTQASIKWFRNAAKAATTTPNKMLGADENIRVKRIDEDMVGSLCFFLYSPKGKDTLPYYDRFPLVFVSDINPDGWSGLNIHYLPPVLRAKLMDALYQTAINKKNPEKTKLKISYKILNALTTAQFFKPCYKQYLAAHLSSNIMKVKPENWDMCAFLPTQRFVKKTAEQVWADSRKAI